jgi:hypothetical protein
MLDDPVVCTLRTASLDAGVEYEALSYCWGDAASKARITVNQYDFGVNHNLHEALRYLRHATKPRIIWDDAISIDQTNVLERNHQIRQMTAVYRHARSVLIWLGACDLWIRRAFERIHMESSGTPHTLYNLGFDALESIISQDWFHRIWTKQELAAANEDPWVVIGDKQTKWRTLCDAVQQVCPGPWFSAAFQSRCKNVLGYDIIRRLYNLSAKMSLHYLIYLTRDSDASDPRDKIYALLGLSSAPNLEEYMPDYSLSTERVSMNTVVQLIQTEKNLRPLLRWQSHSSKLPSWCPQLTLARQDRDAPVPLVDPPDPQLYAASGSKILPDLGSLVHENYIRLRGIKFDIITTTKCGWGEILHNPLHEKGVPTLPGYDIRRHLSRSMPLWRILIANKDIIDGSKVPPPEDYSGTYLDWWRQTPKESRGNKFDYGLSQRSESVMYKRCLFTTKSGFLGIGPYGHDRWSPSSSDYTNTRPGDLVVILFGSEVPFVLRPVGRFFEYVGECYVGGIMDGEFMELWEKHKGKPGCPVERSFTLI